MSASKPENYTWIQTRDGSPTLWNNELGESFRSVKGAFTESWAAFVAPALRHVDGRPEKVRVGEFGLGVGTNWLLWTLAAHARGISFTYTAIERDPSAFHMGLARWQSQPQIVCDFLKERGINFSPAEVESILKSASTPSIYPSLESALEAGTLFDLWFHDPFGFDVNPDGYSQETFELCSQMWARGLWGGSYACNRYFRDSLEALDGIEVFVIPTGNERLKRERMEFKKK